MTNLKADAVDSKGAAIEKILMEFGDEAIDSLFKDEKTTVEAFAEATEAILALLAQEVKRARIDELRRILFKNKLTSGENEAYILERLSELKRERLG